MLVHPSSPTATGSERATLRRASTIGQQRAIARGLRSCHTRQDVIRPRAGSTSWPRFASWCWDIRCMRSKDPGTARAAHRRTQLAGPSTPWPCPDSGVRCWPGARAADQAGSVGELGQGASPLDDLTPREVACCCSMMSYSSMMSPTSSSMRSSMVPMPAVTPYSLVGSTSSSTTIAM
jgi:hypothetical protein